MSKIALISIHAKHLANILTGTKVFEYRKVMPAQDVSYLVLYCTAPMKRIVAVAEVSWCLEGPPSRIWAETSYGAGVTRKFYRNYFLGHKTAASFVLGNVYELSEPLELAKLSSCKVPPQSFCYLNACDTRLVFDKVSSEPSTPSSLIFVGGIHGVGKTTICKKVFAPLGYRCITASSLISAYGLSSDKKKRVDNVSDNQRAIIEQLAIENKKYCRLLLDGHYTLINSQGQIEPINLSIFQKMNPSQLMLIKGEPMETARRLTIRDGKKWNQAFIKAFQKAEEKHARYVSNVIGIPLQIFDNVVSPAKIAKSFRGRN